MAKTHRKLLSLSLRFISLLVFLAVVWQSLILVFQLPSYILPTPWRVVLTIQHDFSLILSQFGISLFETVTGLCLGILTGSIAALLMIRIKPLSYWFMPILLISQAIPTFAIAPLLVIWFGYGIAAKIITTILMVFFPVTSNFYDGLNKTPVIYLEQASLMRASKTSILWRIKLPFASKNWASGVRLAAAYAPVGAIVGEWVGSSKGLGFLILNANARMQMDMVFACLIFIVLLAISLYFLVNALLNYWIDW